MPSLNDPTIMREIIMDHYQYPRHHGLNTDDSAYESVNMNSSTCIDNIDVQAKFDDEVITDIRFDGEACAICTASTSIMTELLSGKTIDDAKKIIDNYMNMIYEKDYDADLLEEAIAFQNTHKQANRIKCATLGWKAIEKLIARKTGGEQDDE